MLSYNLYEKRKSRRIYIQMPVACEIVSPEDKTSRSKTIIASDINSEGICLESDEVLTLNTVINIIFQLPGSSHTIAAAVRVVRVELREDEKTFGIGTIFIKITDKDEEEIRLLVERADINNLLELAIKKEASDLHLVTNMPPVLRIHGELAVLNMPKLDAEEIPRLVCSIMTRQQIKKFERDKELDFGIQYDAHNRFRVNVYQERNTLEAVFRLINNKVSSFEELNIPEAIKDLTRQKEGLVIISGPTGSGKTTTIAAMVGLINQERKAVVITLERPIEYVFLNAKSIIIQREIGIDTDSFATALKSSLRQDPNVIVIGELEDIETIKTALIAAEAGHLVIASIHAPNTLQALDRIASSFPPENRKQILSQLSNCIKGIICQMLIPHIDKNRRVLVTEIVFANDAVKRIIRNDEFVQLPTVIQTSSSYKMQSMADSIRSYVEKGVIDQGIADLYCQESARYSR